MTADFLMWSVPALALAIGAAIFAGAWFSSWSCDRRYGEKVVSRR